VFEFPHYVSECFSQFGICALVWLVRGVISAMFEATSYEPRRTAGWDA